MTEVVLTWQRSVERRTTPISNPPKRSVIQDDIEIEVAEALFDLMKQSQSQSQSKSSQRQVDRNGLILSSDGTFVLSILDMFNRELVNNCSPKSFFRNGGIGGLQS